MRFATALASVVITFAFAGPARAWNDTGHMAVARVAWKQLSDDERKAVGQLLRQHPHYDLYLVKSVPDGVDPDEWAFMKAASWPDFVRPARGGSPGEIFKGPEITRFHRSTWHYVDRPWVPPADRNTIDPATLPARQPAAGAAGAGRTGAASGAGAGVATTQPESFVIDALEQNAKLLATRDADAAERAVALAWLEHLAGDLHQPLHACTVYSAAFPAGDKGGNEEAVRANGNVVRLHGFWDDILGTSGTFTEAAFVSDLLMNDPALAPEKLPELKRGTTFGAWADESYEYAITMVHLNGRLRAARYAAYDAREIAADQVPNLPASYEGAARDLAKRRAALAGYRLAEQVRKALK